MKREILTFVFLGVVILIFTSGLTNTFFQQDEWNGFGVVISLSHQNPLNWFKILGPSHFIPFAQLFWFILYKLFAFQSQYFALSALILHTIASFLVYLLTKNLSKNRFIGIFTAILFATDSRGQQAFTHLAIFPATITSFIGIMMFFLYLIQKLGKKYFKLKDLLVLLLIFFTTVFFREDGLILIPLLPIFIFFYKKEAFNKKNLWFFICFFVVAGGFLLFRFLMQISSPSAISISSNNYLVIYIYNAIVLPIKMVVQNLIQIYPFYLWFWQHKHYFYPVEISVSVMNTVFTDLIFLLLFNLMIVVFVFVARNIKRKEFWHNIYFGVSWVIVNALLLASLGRRVDIIEERYLYLSSFAVMFILSLVIKEIFTSTSTYQFINYAKKIGVIVLMLYIFGMSYTDIQAAIKKYQYQGEARKHILGDLIRLYPTIPQQTIFFVQCKNKCYRNTEFGLPNDLVLPFSSGPGWIFMLYYARNNEDAYAHFFDNVNGKEFLWDYGTEGYKKIGDYSFGYFINKELLKESLKKENIDKKIVIGLEYNEDDFSLRDISNKVQEEL